MQGHRYPYRHPGRRGAALVRIAAVALALLAFAASGSATSPPAAVPSAPASPGRATVPPIRQVAEVAYRLVDGDQDAAASVPGEVPPWARPGYDASDWPTIRFGGLDEVPSLLWA
ncbi:MAG: hypothetical protein MI919_09770, partial [Holophagales bacterium]|nr:hypothetical protein [Holophagales bacterium]